MAFNMDLALVATLDALLAERSVTRAARRLGRTPSAMSHALARCREAFGDELLVRSGRGLALTPRAEALAPRLSAALAEVGRALAAEPPFDPASTRRRVTLVCPDLVAAFLPELLVALSEAPGLDLEVIAPGPRGTAATLVDGAHDLGLGGPPPDEAGVRGRRLGAVRFAIVVRRGHPLTEGELTVERWLSWPHVVIRTGGSGLGWVGEALARAGHVRRVGLVVPTFLLAPHAVARTDLVLAAPEAIVAPLVGPLGLCLLPMPLEVAPLPVVLTWPERLHDDPASRWIRERVAASLSPALGG